MLDSATTSRAAPSGLRVSEVADPEAFEQLRDEWNALVEADPRATFFQTWEFQYHTWRIFADDVTPCLVTVRDSDGNLIGCAPLGTKLWRLGPLSVRVLGFSSPRYCDYNNFIVRGDRAEHVLAAFTRWFDENIQRWHVVELRSIREDSWITREDLFLAKLGCPFRIERMDAAPYLRLDPSWSSYEDALSPKRAKKMRYEVRRLFREFGGQLRAATSVPALDRAIGEFFDLHQVRMRQQHQMGHFADPTARDAFRVLIRELASRGLAKMHTIATEDQAIAAISTYEFRGVVSYFLGGFDPDYGRFSPGNVVQALRIDEALVAGASEYDFLLGDEPYKYFWANDAREIYHLSLITRSWRRHPYRSATELRRRLSRSEKARSLYLRLKKKADRD